MNGIILSNDETLELLEIIDLETIESADEMQSALEKAREFILSNNPSYDVNQ